MASYHVVVVDDEVSNLESLERILKSDGGRVAVFRDPHEALRYLQQEQPEWIP
jgi:PleD family two-component response regulator